MPVARTLILWFLCCFTHTVMPADTLSLSTRQHQPYNVSASYRTGTGFIIPHHPDMEPYTRKHFKTVELALSHQTDGSKNWHATYKYPQTGIAFFYSELSDMQVLGTVTAIYPFINFPVINGRIISVNLRFGLGAGYFSNKFDTLTNWRNHAIGSQINGTADLYLNIRLRLYHNTLLEAGTGFMHYSNGATVMPNYGINIPTVRFGISTALIGKDFATYTHEKKVKIARPEISFSASMGYKGDELGLIDGDYVYKASVNYHHPLGLKSRVIIGFDADYNYLSRLMLDKFNIYYDGNEDIIRYWLSIGAELTLPSVVIFAKTGYYLQGLDQLDGRYPQLIGVRYYFAKRVFTEVALKTHYGKADYLTGGIGFSIIESVKK